MEIVVDRKNFLYPQYIFQKPCHKDISVFDFQNKSLEKIEQDYGKQIALFVYQEACHGRDLTKEILPIDTPTKDVVEIYKEETLDSIKVYLKANSHTEAKKDICILDVDYISALVPMQARKQMIADAINRLSNR